MSDLTTNLEALEDELEDLYCSSPPGLQPMDAPLVRDIVDFIHRVAATGAIADENSLIQPNARFDLQALIEVWSQRLELLTGVPVEPPALAPFERPELDETHPADLVARLQEPVQVGGPARALSGRKFMFPKGEHALLEEHRMLHNCDFRRFGLIDCRFEELELTGSRFGPESTLTRTWFEHCNLDNIESMVTPGEDVVGNLEGGLRASSCVFKRCTFAGASLAGTSFSYCEFNDLEIGSARSDADLRNAVFTASTFKDAKFHAKLDNAVFTDCDLTGAKFEGADLDQAVFSECDLTGVDFSGADLNGAIFSNCSLAGASFGPIPKGNRLRAADLSNADLARCRNLTADQLRTALLNEWTLLPPDIVDAVVELQPSWSPRLKAHLAD